MMTPPLQSKRKLQHLDPLVGPLHLDRRADEQLTRTVMTLRTTIVLLNSFWSEYVHSIGACQWRVVYHKVGSYNRDYCSVGHEEAIASFNNMVEAIAFIYMILKG